MQEHSNSLRTVVLTSFLVSLATLAVGYQVLIAPRLAPAEPSATGSETVLTLDPIQTIPDVVEAVIPAVASIVISADVPVIERYYESWDPFNDLFGRGFGFQVPRQRQIGTQRQEVGGGTGFFVSADGYLITNKHVVDQDGVEYSVVTNEGTSYPVTVVAKDPMLDVAILKVTDPETTFPFLTFAAASEVRLGEPVIAIGNALTEFPNSVSVGVISGLSRSIVAGDGFRFTEVLDGLIQTDAAINPGNSGGPLLNVRGEVVGVNVAVAGYGENIGFALPSSMVSSAYETVMEHGKIVRPFLGVRYVAVTKELAERNNLSVDYGVLIVRGQERGDLAVIPGSPADKAGLEENDIILKIEDQPLNEGAKSLATILSTYRVGETITLTVLHDGEEKTVRVTLEELQS